MSMTIPWFTGCDELVNWTEGPERLQQFLRHCHEADGVDLAGVLDASSRFNDEQKLARAFRQLVQGAALRFMAFPPDLVIGRAEATNTTAPLPYLSRWYVLPRNKYCNVYLHKFTRSDHEEALHDHPWRSLSFVLHGTGIEHLENQQQRSLKPGDVIYRGLLHAHRIELTSPVLTTLFITGPIRRNWGFHCPQGWKSWQEFLGDTNYGGQQPYPGCGVDHPDPVHQHDTSH